MPRTPRFIYFDLGNVLLHFSHHRAARQIAAVAGISEDLAWQTVFGSELENDYEWGRINTREFWEEFCRTTKTRPDFATLVHAAADIFELNSAIVPLVAHLHAARYPLGILSNTNEAHWQFISQGRYAVIHSFFAVHALSFELRTMKPEPRIYAEAAALARTEPEAIFFTDDRLENVSAACDAGFDAVLFKDARQLAAELRAREIRWNF